MENDPSCDVTSHPRTTRRYVPVREPVMPKNLSGSCMGHCQELRYQPTHSDRWAPESRYRPTCHAFGFVFFSGHPADRPANQPTPSTPPPGASGTACRATTRSSRRPASSCMTSTAQGGGGELGGGAANPATAVVRAMHRAIEPPDSKGRRELYGVKTQKAVRGTPVGHWVQGRRTSLKDGTCSCNFFWGSQNRPKNFWGVPKNQYISVYVIFLQIPRTNSGVSCD